MFYSLFGILQTDNSKCKGTVGVVFGRLESAHPTSHDHTPKRREVDPLSRIHFTFIFAVFQRVTPKLKEFSGCDFRFTRIST
jgi:hypothetical protein